MSAIDPSAFDFESERLHLRPLDEGDGALFHGLYTDPETMRFIAPPLSTEQAASKFRKIVVRQREPSLRWRFLAILEKATRKPVGICGTSRYDAEALRLEVGIVLNPGAGSRGFAREALAALMNRVFAVSSIDEIWVECSMLYPAVERMVSAVGFTPCMDGAGNEVLSSKRIWSVHRSSWYVNQASN
ncbi:MAG TPA: GNAT family N-acetyltransferase [Rhodanobacter sp.]